MERNFNTPSHPRYATGRIELKAVYEACRRKPPLSGPLKQAYEVGQLLARRGATELDMIHTPNFPYGHCSYVYAACLAGYDASME